MVHNIIFNTAEELTDYFLKNYALDYYFPKEIKDALNKKELAQYWDKLWYQLIHAHREEFSQELETEMLNKLRPLMIAEIRSSVDFPTRYTTEYSRDYDPRFCTYTNALTPEPQLSFASLGLM